jgi:pentose-5-phosphate-3-epimerase
MTRVSRTTSARISAVVSDVDGTLVTDDKRLTAPAQATVAELHARGFTFTRGLGPWIDVDGGQNSENAALAGAAGPNAIVAGSAIFGPDGYAAANTRIGNGASHKMAVAQ